MRATQSTVRAITALLATLAVAVASALDVERIDWGFDGQVVPLMFNMVTVEVANNSNTPFEGDVELREGSGIGRTDLPLIERQLYIEPFGRRRLQFFPFITEAWTEFHLIWGDSQKERMPIAGQGAPLRTGPRAVVLFRDASASRTLRSKLPSYDEADFPISVAGTDALRAVVLDHVPRWDALRMQAFRDWIGAGGEVHLLQDVGGAYPTFPAPLEALNEPSDEVAVGNGRCFHHAMTTADLSDSFIESTLGFARDPAARQNRRGNQYGYQSNPSNSIAPLLRDLTRPDHNWGLIYFLSFIYLLVVFPGCWLLGRRRADFRVSYPALLGAVFLFSMAFKTVGQRGYGEQTAWNSVGSARRVAPGRFLTESWSNAFVTSGGMYTFKHAGEGQIYSSGGSADTRRGHCTNRPSAEIETEIPPFSSQTILHAAVVKAPDFDVQLVSSDGNSRAPQLEFAISGQAPKFHSLHAAYGGQWIVLSQSGTTLRTASFTPLQNMAEAAQQQRYSRYNANPLDTYTIYQSAENPLIARNLDLFCEDESGQFRIPDGLVRVFLYADTPTEFLDVTGGPEKRQGRMLYTFDLPLEN